jgi:hypothetical protein
MRVFSCGNCGQRTYFENVRCERCGTTLGFLPDRRELHAFRPVPDAGEECWTPVAPEVPGRFRRCANWIDYDVCNWMVPEASPQRYCLACRLNDVIPDLGQPGNLQLWARLEAAKRRVVDDLMAIGMEVVPKSDDPERGLAFRFLAELPGSDEPATTGHEDGIITVNLAEADDAERERRRAALHEPYRTLVGHFRHESGHYYWDLLIAGNEEVLSPFRELFGDERADYQEALRRHYDQGPPPDWRERFVTAYAAMHPWEDWAETWAHYLHVRSTLETAEAVGIRAAPSCEAASLPDPVFDDLLACWNPLTEALNELNRSMGLPDLYPFVLSPPAVDKLRFVHDVVSRRRTA